MINGNPHDFIDTVYSGQDIPSLFHNEKYWFQGYNKNGGCHMEVMACFPLYDYIWEHDAIDYQSCGDAFQEARIFRENILGG